MRTGRLKSFLERHQGIGLDTSVFIFQIERNLKYFDSANEIFVWLETPKGRAVTSTITMMELLVHPYRSSDIDRVNSFYALLSSYPHLEWVEVTLEIADRATQLRAEYNLRIPDAVQAATALECQASGFISNDNAFKRIAGLDVILLEDLAAN